MIAEPHGVESVGLGCLGGAGNVGVVAHGEAADGQGQDQPDVRPGLAGGIRGEGIVVDHGRGLSVICVIPTGAPETVRGSITVKP